MRFNNSLLLIALITLSYANSFEFASFAEISEIQADPYGKSLIETISLSLSNKGNVEEVTKLLDDLLFKLNQDQQSDDVAWATESARLKKEIARLTEEIAQIEAQIVKLKEKLKKYEALRDQAEKNLKQYADQKAKNDEVLKSNDAKRVQDAAEFKQSQSDHTDVINAIDQVVAELEHLTGSISGAGKPTHVAINAEEKRDAADKIKSAFLEISQEEAEINAFVELATTADQEALRNLISKLEKIKDNTKASFNDDKQKEEESIAAHATLKGLLESDNLKLAGMILEETANLNKYRKIIDETKVAIEAQEKLLESTKKLLESTKEEFKTKETKYLKDKAQRDQERVVIIKIQGIVQKRLANMSAYLKEKSNN